MVRTKQAKWCEKMGDTKEQMDGEYLERNEELLVDRAWTNMAIIYYIPLGLTCAERHMQKYTSYQCVR